MIRAATLAGLLLVCAAPAIAQGLVEDDPAALARAPVAPLHRSFLPARVDLSPGFPVPGSQGAQGSCTGWAVGYALRSYYDHKKPGWSATDPSRLFSPAFVYNSVRKGGCDDGASINAAIASLADRGVVTLADYPYDPARCDPPPAPVTAAAAARRSLGFRRIDSSKLDNIKGELAAGRPVAFGMNVGREFSAFRGTGVFDTEVAPAQSGHAMVLVGYDDARGAFRLINSWGTRWGDGGFGWVSYRVIARDLRPTSGAYVLTDPPPGALAPQPVAVLPPTPRPSPPTPPQAITPPPAPPPATDQNAELARLTADIGCGRLRIAAQTPGRASLAGFVQDEATRRALVARAAALTTPIALDMAQVRVAPWPACEALLTLGDPIDGARGLAAQVVLPETGTAAPRRGEAVQLIDGQRFALRLTAPDFPAYLHVAFLPAGGGSVTVLDPDDARRRLPQAVVRFGEGAGEPEYRVSPPFGREYLVVVATAQPLFAEVPTETLTERQWLTRVRVALGRAGGPSAALILPLDSEPKR